jgi:hypothetical protein
MRIFTSLGWGGITLLGFLLLGANAIWIAREGAVPSGGSNILVVQWLCVLASLILICIVSGYLANGRLTGIFIDDRYRMSLARFQWIVWFIVLLSGYFTGAVWDVAYGGDLPVIDPNLFGLIGITTGSAVVSNLLVNTKKTERSSTLKDGRKDDTLDGLMDKNKSPAEASWADLYLGEEDATRGSVDVSRLQKFVTTLLLITTYLQMIWSALSAVSQQYDSFSMPVVGTNFVVLLGASHAGYLAYKATPKKPSNPTDPASVQTAAQKLP